MDAPSTPSPHTDKHNTHVVAWLIERGRAAVVTPASNAMSMSEHRRQYTGQDRGGQSQCGVCERDGLLKCPVHKATRGNPDWWRSKARENREVDWSEVKPCDCLRRTPSPSTHIRPCNCQYHRDDLT